MGRKERRQSRACPLADGTRTRIESRLGFHLDCGFYACGTTQPCVCRGLSGCATIACIRLSPQQWIADCQSTYERQHARDRGAGRFLDLPLPVPPVLVDTVAARRSSHTKPLIQTLICHFSQLVSPFLFFPSVFFPSPRSPDSRCSSQCFAYEVP